jgi:hypothetical protein
LDPYLTKLHGHQQLWPLDAQFDTAPIEQDAAQELETQTCDFPYCISVEGVLPQETAGYTAGTSILMDIDTLRGELFTLVYSLEDQAGTEL